MREVQPRRLPDPWTLRVLAGAALALVLLVTAVALDRGTWPLEYDESHYLELGHRLADRLEGFDLRSFAAGYVYDTDAIAPVVPALAAVPIWLGVPDPVAGFLVLGVFGLVALVAVLALARSCLPAGAARPAPLLLAASAGVVEFAGTFLFALPAAATLTAGAAALVRSDGLRHRGWSLAAGLALGTALAVRANDLALVPVLVLAYLVAYRRTLLRDVRGRLAGAALGVAGALAVAGPWYVKNLDSVWGYLTGYGYGDEAGDYAGELGFGDPGFYLRRPWQTLEDVGLLVVLALVVSAVLARRARVAQPGPAPDPARRTALLFVGLWLVAGLALLTSSENEGIGFTVPFVAPALVLGLALCARLAGSARLPAWPAAVCLVVVGALVVVRPEVPTDPGDGLQDALAVVGLRAPVGEYYLASGFRGGDEAAWEAVNQEVAAASPGNAAVVLDADGLLANTVTIDYERVRAGLPAVPTRLLRPGACRDAASCAAALRAEPRPLLVVLPRPPLITPGVDRAGLLAALEDCERQTVQGGRATTFRCGA